MGVEGGEDRDPFPGVPAAPEGDAPGPGGRPDADGWRTDERDGLVRVARREGAEVADIEGLSRRERRQRIRRARHDGRRLYRGRFVPRTLRAMAAVAVAMGLAAGAATATTYAIMDARVARAERAEGPAPEVPAAPQPSIAAGPSAAPGTSDIVFDATATGSDATIEGLGVAVARDGDRTFWLTAYDIVEASTVVPAAPVTVRSTEAEADVWTWDEQRGLGLLATTDVEATARSWVPAELTIAPGSLLTVVLPSADGPPLPVTASVEDPLDGPRDTATVRADGVILPLGAAVTAPDGGLVGIITAVDHTDGNTVATVVAIRSACARVLECTDVGG